MIRAIDIRSDIGDLYPLVRENGQEILGDAFNPSYAQFLSLEDAGVLRTFLFENASGSYGYAMFVVSPLLLQHHLLTANCIALFVQKSSRGLSTIKHLKHIEQALMAEGLDQIQYQTDARYTTLFESLGYKKKEVTFIKEGRSWQPVSQ